MATAHSRTRFLAFGALFALAVTGGPVAAQSSAAGEPVKLTWTAGPNVDIQTRIKALAAAYTAKHPNVTFEFVTLPDGPDGDTTLKLALSQGDAGDLIWYNSGSLLQTLNPTETMLDVSAEPFIANMEESYLPSVSVGDAIFGVPGEPAMAGGILYNKKVYSDLGLSVPRTWAEFTANNEVIKGAGITPVAATFGSDAMWTSQILVLADYCNVEAAVPGFAEKYTNNQAHYADTPAAMAGFQHLQDGYDKGWWQQDYGAALFAEGLEAVAKGTAAHYPMLTFSLGTIKNTFPDLIDNVGYFGVPGDDAAKNCATLWEPSAIYIAKNSPNVEVAKDFLGFVASVEGTDVITKAVAPSGPYVIKGAALPAGIPAVKDIQAYIDGDAATPALEFLSPVKGPNLQNITIAVGSGQNTAAEGAALSDQDVAKQAKQLGLPGW